MAEKVGEGLAGSLHPPSLGAKKSTQTCFVQSFSKTLRGMDVRTENRGRPHQKVRFSVALVMGSNFLTQRRPGVRVRNVRGKSGPKSLCLCCFFFPEILQFPKRLFRREGGCDSMDIAVFQLYKTTAAAKYSGRAPNTAGTFRQKLQKNSGKIPMARRFATRIGAIRANRFAEKPLFS